MPDNRDSTDPDELTSLNWLNDIRIGMKIVEREQAVPVKPQVMHRKRRRSANHYAPVVNGKKIPKPPYPYAQLIYMAIESSMTGLVRLGEIYRYIVEHFPYFRTADSTWQNSVRHNLSTSKYFEKIPRRQDPPGKGSYWRLSPQYKNRLPELFLNKRMKHQAFLPEGQILIEEGPFSAILGPGPLTVIPDNGIIQRRMSAPSESDPKEMEQASKKTIKHLHSYSTRRAPKKPSRKRRCKSESIETSVTTELAPSSKASIWWCSDKIDDLPIIDDTNSLNSSGSAGDMLSNKSDDSPAWKEDELERNETDVAWPTPDDDPPVLHPWDDELFNDPHIGSLMASLDGNIGLLNIAQA